MPNICDYRPMINLSLREMNRRLDFIHRYLCALGAAVPGEFQLTVVPVTTNGFLIPGTESNILYTNDGAEEGIEIGLPPAVTGLSYTFARVNANTLGITLSSGDTVRVGILTGDSSQSVQSNDQGDVITLVAVNNTEWIATSMVGTWSIPIPP